MLRSGRQIAGIYHWPINHRSVVATGAHKNDWLYDHPLTALKILLAEPKAPRHDNATGALRKGDFADNLATKLHAGTGWLSI